MAAYLDTEVYPRLQAGAIYIHESHNWQLSGDKWRGGCPWHQSKSGSAFVVTPSSLLWYCAGCCVGGSPVQYLHRLGGGTGSPRGEAFLAIVRRLCDLAGVPFPERELTPEEREQARRLETRRAIIGGIYECCHMVLTGSGGETARAYLGRRGLDASACTELTLGLYPETATLERQLKQAGFSPEDIKESSAVWSGMTGYATFPWLDDQGRPLTLYGKWPGKDLPDRKPKTTALPNPKDAGTAWEHTKRSPLYLDRALRAGHTHVVLVEGVTDAAVPQVLGDTSVIACVAGLLSEQQLETLRRRGVNAVTLALDPDVAGDNNVLSNINRLLHANITPYVAPRLPDGMDPDDFLLARGLNAWKVHTSEAIHGYRHVSQLLLAQATGGAA